MGIVKDKLGLEVQHLWAGMTSLTKDHIPQLVQDGAKLAASLMTDDQIVKHALRYSPDMYVDDNPGMRGNAQRQVMECALALEARELMRKKMQ